VLTCSVAAILGFVTLRLGGHFLSLSTVAWGLAIAFLFGNIDGLGQHNGISGIPPISIGPFALVESRQIYFLIWAIVVAVLFVCYNLLDSRTGRAMRALRGGNTLVESLGISAFQIKLVTFVIAAFLGALSGWLYAHLGRFVSPGPFDASMGIEYLMMAMVGGAGSILGGVVGAVLLIVLPFGHRQALMLSLVGMVVCLSLVVITGFVGQVSLAQVTLAGVSGFVVSHMVVSAGIGFPWGPLAGSLAAVLVGLIVGASALRVRGPSLAVVTLAGVVAIEQFGFANRRWGAGASGSPVKQPTLFGADLGSNASFRGIDGKVPSPMLGFVYVAVVIGLCLLVSQIRRSVLGQQMLAVRANERAAAATGINVARVKIIAYGISSFIAGTAGWMYAYNFGSVSAARFGFLIALGFVAFAYIGGITMVSGAVVGGLVATEGLVPHFFQNLLGISGNWTLLVGGLLLIVTLIQNPDGVAGSTYRKRQLKQKAARASESTAPHPLTAAAAVVDS